MARINWTRTSLARNESGMALVTTLLVMMLISALVAGTFAAVTADQRANLAGRDQTQVYAAAHAGLEKLTADLAALFAEDASPSVSEINELATRPPGIPDTEFRAPGGAAGSGYQIAFETDANGNPVTNSGEIQAGPYQGLFGAITPYTITVTASSPGGAEVRLRRTLQTVAVPAFQFGVFSESDLTFYAGDNFDFGGRVHTNGNLFLSELSGYVLKFTDRITAVGEVVRAFLSNGRSVGSVLFTGTVSVPTSIGNPGKYRSLATTEGSILGMPDAPDVAANPNWPGLVAQYKNNILNGGEGAKKLELPLVLQGAKPIDLIRRPPVDSNENTANAPVFEQRFFSQASLRILLSDRAEDLTDLPTVTAAAPVELTGVIGGHPISRSVGPIPATVTHATTDSIYDTSGAYPVATIMLSGAVPSELRLPSLAVATAPPQTVNCQGRTPTSFLGCGLSADVPAGTTITGSVDGVEVIATSTALAAAGTRDIQVGSTFPFASGAFKGLWAIDSQGPKPISCTGYDEKTATTPKRLLGCSGLASRPARGSAVSTYSLVTANQSLIGGFIKIEKQSSAGAWTDVTDEILGLGIGAANQDGAACGDPTATAVIRIQRLRDHGAYTCPHAGSASAYDWWPNTLYDTREGNYRDVGTTTAMRLGGVMHYISLDINNLKRWFAGTIGATGSAARNNNGYIVYFSDRRGNHNEALAGHPETGEYGFEDVINPASATGDQNGLLDAGEDANDSETLDRYGEQPWTSGLLAGAVAPYGAAARPWTLFTSANATAARLNRQVLFRRALKLVNGGIVSGVNGLPTSGLTVASENPVYVQGNYNATTSPTAEPNVPAAIIADAVTVLSNNWKDTRSFMNPNSAAGRDATTTAYRFGVIAGKNLSFTYPTTGAPQFLFGTDGGAGNFLRLLEHWNTDGVSINYRGSIISLYYSRQATGTFKYNSNVYNYGDRNFTFDTDFRSPTLLPPGTPMFRDINTLTFRQILRPTE